MRRPDPVEAAGTKRAQRGSMLLAIVFFMVVGSALAAALLSVTRHQAADVALDVHGARAYWAARSAIEWGTYQVLDPNNAQGLTAGQLPGCFASPKALALPGDLAGFTVTVSCQRHPASGAHEEQLNLVATYVLAATASSGAAGAPDRVERRIEARVVKCKAPVVGVAPGYEC
jgi:MSHA biogenesis protein MshP